VLRRTVSDASDALALRTVGTAEYDTVLILNSVTDNSAAAVVAGRSQCVNGALETIKGMDRPAKRYLESLVVFIAANFTTRHRAPPADSLRQLLICAAR